MIRIDPRRDRLPDDLVQYGRIDTPAAMRGTPGELHGGLSPAPDCRLVDPDRGPDADR